MTGQYRQNPAWHTTHGGDEVLECRAIRANQVNADVAVERAPDHVTLHVDDRGPGVPPAERARIFERFARGSSVVSGSGLGLALAAQQAALHGGSVEVGDGPEGGARFTVRLPAGHAPAED